MSEPALWIALAAGLVSGFFAANNHALLDFSRGRLEELLTAKGKGHRIAWLDQVNELILMTAVVRTALNLTILLATIAWFAPPEEVRSWWDLLFAMLSAGAIIAVLGVAVPVSWGRHAAEPLLMVSLPILRLCYFVLRPVLIVLHWFDPIVRRLLGVREDDEDDRSPLEQEILDAVSEGEKSGLVDESQKEMIEAVVEFPTTSVDEIMTPRTDMIGIPVEASIEQVKQMITDAGHSRFPVYEGDMDHIVGVLYAKDLLQRLGDPTRPFNLRQVVRGALFVPESKTLRDLLREFQARKVHIALVLDEYGGTAGLVTIEDILEEIVGEIQDEYETQTRAEPGIHRLSPTQAEVDGRVHIDDVNDELDLDLPEDEDYDTIGGYVFATLGHVPEVGETFVQGPVRLTVIDAEKTKVNKVRLDMLDAATADALFDGDETPAGK